MGGFVDSGNKQNRPTRSSAPSPPFAPVSRRCRSSRPQFSSYRELPACWRCVVVELPRRTVALPVALFPPGVAVVVVAVLLPESWLVPRQELHAADPLRALPGIE